MMKRGISLAEIAMAFVIAAIVVSTVAGTFMHIRVKRQNEVVTNMIRETIMRMAARPLSYGAPDNSEINMWFPNNNTTARRIMLTIQGSAEENGSIYPILLNDRWVLNVMDINIEQCHAVFSLSEEMRIQSIDRGTGLGSYREKTWSHTTKDACVVGDNDIRVTL